MKSSKYNIYLSANERFYVFNQLALKDGKLRDIGIRVCLNLTRGYISGLLSIPSKVFLGEFRQVSSVTMPASHPPQLTQISPKILFE